MCETNVTIIVKNENAGKPGASFVPGILSVPEVRIVETDEAAGAVVVDGCGPFAGYDIALSIFKTEDKLTTVIIAGSRKIDVHSQLCVFLVYDILVDEHTAR